MFEKLQQIVGRAISGYEAQKIMNWVNNGIYTEQQILDAYDYCQVKTLNYIAKYLENQKPSIKPKWFDKQIEKEQTSADEILELQKIMKEFYNNDEEWQNKTNELIGRIKNE